MNICDNSGRQAQVAIFGDQIVGDRHPDVLVQFQYNISTEDVTEVTTGTGATSLADATATLSSGLGVGSSSLESRDTLRYQPGFDGYALFTAAFSAAGSGTYQRAGLFDSDNGMWIGQEDGTFYIARRFDGTDFKAEVNTSNSNTAVDTVDFTKTNIYRISFGWLGVAPIIFEIFEQGHFREIGRITVANTQAQPSVEQPVQPITFEVGRTSGAGAVTLSTNSWSAGRIGFVGNEDLPSDRYFESVNTKSGVSTETSILTVRNKSTFQGKTNRVVVHFNFITASSDGTKNVIIHAKKNSTLGGTPAYTDVNSDNSVVDVDAAGTTVTGGQDKLPVTLGKEGSQSFIIRELSLKLYPGETMTFSAESANNTEVTIGVSWHEEF